MKSPAVVVDTNVLVSGLITADRCSPVCLIVDAMLTGEMVFLISDKLLDEYRKVLLRPRVRRLHGLDELQVDRILIELVTNGLWREAVGNEVAPDPGDSHLWRLLRAHRNSVPVTADQLLLEQPPDFASVIAPATYVREFLRDC